MSNRDVRRRPLFACGAHYNIIGNELRISGGSNLHTVPGWSTRGTIRYSTFVKKNAKDADVISTDNHPASLLLILVMQMNTDESGR